MHRFWFIVLVKFHTTVNSNEDEFLFILPVQLHSQLIVIWKGEKSQFYLTIQFCNLKSIISQNECIFLLLILIFYLCRVEGAE